MNDNQVMAIVNQLARIADALEQIEDSICSMDESLVIATKQSYGSAGTNLGEGT